jgi:eukaryotic-like serine/threonine-protein kinase
MDVGAPPQIIGRYAIYGKIASGGMASVHFGRLLAGAGFSRTVAVKRLHPHLAEDPEFLSTLMDEARLAARIHHPNVVPTLDVVTTDGELLLVMEYIRGESFARLLRHENAHGRRVPLDITSAIVIGALHGLHAAHEATSDHGAPLGIVHRDISPQNILVGVDGVARVIDFGVAKAAGRLQTTREGTIKGKIAYMAPEQLAAREVTRAADVYAMGVILWEALTGKRLFQGENDAVLVGQVTAGVKTPPSAHEPGLPAGIDAVVMKALSPDPAHRFTTARQMADTLMRSLPPAFPTDVGEWCERAAQEALAKRAHLLGDIESHSGAAPAPPSSTPSLAEGTWSRAMRAARQTTPEGSPRTFSDDAVPSVGSQASSLALETSGPSAASASRPRRRLVLVAAGASAMMLLLLGGVVALRSGPNSAAAPAPAAPPPAIATTPAPSEAPTTPVTAPATGAPPLASAELWTPSLSAPATGAPSEISAKPAAPASHSVVAPPRAQPKTSCNPPYTFDSAGKKVWKRECF